MTVNCRDPGSGLPVQLAGVSAGFPGVVQVQVCAGAAQAGVRAAADVFGQHLSCLVAELAGQLIGAGRDPHGEAFWIVLAELEFAAPRG